MKIARGLIRVGFLLMLPCCAGCFQISLYAPHGMNVYLVSSKQPTQVRREWRTFFVVWGVVPLDNKMPDEVIASEKLSEVRVITIDTVPDAFLGALYTVLLPIGLVNQSIIVEGNRDPQSLQSPQSHPISSGP